MMVDEEVRRWWGRWCGAVRSARRLHEGKPRIIASEATSTTPGVARKGDSEEAREDTCKRKGRCLVCVGRRRCGRIESKPAGRSRCRSRAATVIPSVVSLGPNVVSWGPGKTPGRTQRSAIAHALRGICFLGSKNRHVWSPRNIFSIFVERVEQFVS